MTSFSWQGLNPVFATKCKTVLETLKTKDILIRPYSGFRSLEEQSKLWRMGRSLKEINEKIGELQSLGCNYLANHILNVGPQLENVVETHSIPGFSWHNWGYALDCVVYFNNDLKQPDWNGDHPNYKTYADEACTLGLGAGLYFNGKFKDPDHIQMYHKEIPNLYSIKYVNDYFEGIKG